MIDTQIHTGQMRPKQQGIDAGIFDETELYFAYVYIKKGDWNEDAIAEAEKKLQVEIGMLIPKEGHSRIKWVVCPPGASGTGCIEHYGSVAWKYIPIRRLEKVND